MTATVETEAPVALAPEEVTTPAWKAAGPAVVRWVAAIGRGRR